mmetsp:Transcript_103026/g.210069  ORF Transcript_103026/g.210069 Transcript_103026/m.210069 type:complete len:112 (-) Transcript_103026:20-355(-)
MTQKGSWLPASSPSAAHEICGRDDPTIPAVPTIAAFTKSRREGVLVFVVRESTGADCCSAAKAQRNNPGSRRSRRGNAEIMVRVVSDQSKFKNASDIICLLLSELQQLPKR